MIELYEDELNMPDRRSSKGNQLKFKRGEYWYKADYLGYEGLAEYTVSKLLKHSTLDAGEYVDYELDLITYNGQVFNACRSIDFGFDEVEDIVSKAEQYSDEIRSRVINTIMQMRRKYGYLF